MIINGKVTVKLNKATLLIRYYSGLETLTLLETLDASNNLLNKFVDVRTLSFNIHLREVRLTGMYIVVLTLFP